MTDALSSLAETFKNVGVSMAYGPAVTVGGEELVPVALVSFGFGGGQTPGDGNNAGGNNAGGNNAGGNNAGGNADAGSSALDSGQESAAGGGGGCVVLPLGVYCRGRHGKVAFRPNSMAVLAGLVPLVCAVGISVRGVLRTVRRR